MGVKKISKRVQWIGSYWTHGYGKFTCRMRMRKAYLLMYFTGAQNIYWMYGCAFYWCTENLLDARLSEFAQYAHTCLTRRKQLVSKKISMVFSQSNYRDSIPHFINNNNDIFLKCYMVYPILGQKASTLYITDAFIWRWTCIYFRNNIEGMENTIQYKQ